MEGKKDLTRLPNQFSFIMKPFHTNRSFGNLFGEEIDLIRERVRFFQTRRDWYDDKGIPYTLGILLSGPPGTGKTSTIKCLANESNRHIFSVAMGSDMTRVQLENLFYNENVVVVVDGQTQTVCIPLDQRLYVLEDADAQQGSMLLRRKEKPVAKRVSEATVRPRFELEDAGEHLKVDLSFLLNLLDGALENPGRLLVMTSNHPEKLDEALVRPGRIDVVAQFKTCSLATLRKMVEFFYETPLETRHIQALQEVVSDAVKGLPEAATKVGLTEAATKVGLPEAATKVGLPEAAVKGLTPAQVYRLLFQHFGDVDAAIDAMRAEVGLSAAEEKPLSTEEEWQDTRAELDKVVEEIRSNLQQKSNYSEEETRMENKVVEEVRKNLREQFQHVPDPVSYSWESNFTQLCGHDNNNSWENQYQKP